MARSYLLVILVCSQLVTSNLGLPLTTGEAFGESNDGHLILQTDDEESDSSSQVASPAVSPINENLNRDQDVDSTANQDERMANEQGIIIQTLSVSADDIKSFRVKRGVWKKIKKTYQNIRDKIREACAVYPAGPSGDRRPHFNGQPDPKPQSSGSFSIGCKF